MPNLAAADSSVSRFPLEDLSGDVRVGSRIEVPAFRFSVKDGCNPEHAKPVAEGALVKRWLKETPVNEALARTGANEIATPQKAKNSQPKPKRKKTKASKKTLGTARGIETMFRSAYRTQLDLTALAATKANIMISLNGLILSVLTLSGPFVLVAEPLLTMPIAIFLATCLISIIFAVLAAQPHRLKSDPTPADFKKDRANVLVFEEFSALSEDQHLDAMLGLMHDNDRIYKNMSRQIYMLGSMANRHFRMLSLSYTTFLAGLSVSTLLLLGIGFFFHAPDFASIVGQISQQTLG